VLSDPDFAALLRAKQEGKPVKIGTVDDEPKEPVKKKSMKDMFGISDSRAATPEDLDHLPNSKLMDILADSIEDYVSTALKTTVTEASKNIDARFKEFESTQEKIKAAIIDQARNTGAQVMSTKYPDFNNYAQEAFKTAQTSNLSLEDAYLLIKAKKRGLAPDISETEYERPTAVPTRMRDIASRRSAEGDERDAGHQAPPSNYRNFRLALSSAFDKASRKQDFSR